MGDMSAYRRESTGSGGEEAEGGDEEACFGFRMVSPAECWPALVIDHLMPLAVLKPRVEIPHRYRHHHQRPRADASFSFDPFPDFAHEGLEDRLPVRD